MATTSSWQRGPCATVRAAVPGHVPSPCPGRARGPVPSAGPVPGRVPGAHLPVTVPEPPCPPSPAPVPGPDRRAGARWQFQHASAIIPLWRYFTLSLTPD